VKIGGKEMRSVWFENQHIMMIDQRLLPWEKKILRIATVEDAVEAIRNMSVRGAPAIGATAAYAMALAALTFRGGEWQRHLRERRDLICAARPTAQDLFDGADHVLTKVRGMTPQRAKEAAIQAASQYADAGVEACREIGRHGEALIPGNARILTHCNAGALATVDHGTALAPVRAAVAAGKKVFVFADETRPRLQGANLTAFELSEEGIPHAIIADNAAGYLMVRGEIDICIVGADRIAANGDVANKIGTYEKAVLAKENNIPFYVAAPMSTFDWDCATGKDIPIEERSEDEVLYVTGLGDDGKVRNIRVAPMKSHAKNPAFDVTPARYITGIITPSGVYKPGMLRRSLGHSR